MRTRRRLTWLIFIICILAVLEGLGYVTWHALRLERREREAQAATQFQQAIRLALWRMESKITPIIAAEAARPYFHYISFYPAERAYTKMFQQVKEGEVLVPSPLLESSGQFTRLHFQIEPDGTVTSPQAPAGNMRDLAEGQQYLDSEFIVLAGQMLEEVVAMVRPAADKRPLAVSSVREQSVHRQLGAAATQSAPHLQQQQTWQIEDSAEYKAREKAAQTAVNVRDASRKSQVAERPAGDRPALDLEDRSPTSTRGEAAGKLEAGDQKRSGSPTTSGLASPPPPPAPPTPTSSPTTSSPTTSSPTKAAEAESKPDARKDDAPQSLLKEFQTAATLSDESRIDQGTFSGSWYVSPRSGEEELILERPVHIDGVETRQGIWVDWPQLREELKASIEDLLPEGTLCAATDRSEAGQRLAAIPVRLLPGPMTPVAAAAFTPTHTTLLVTWIAVLGAIVAIGIVLRKAMELSDRRGRFVSAVTHELRTPLTTFCLYTEMLSDGMVTEESARQQYLGTLKNESSRLARIVQNVLDYAGIGGVGRRTPGPAAAIRVTDLLERLRPTLEKCAGRAGMTLVLSSEAAGGAVVAADPQTVERIILNLVENAGKYASGATDKRVHVTGTCVESGKVPSVRICVRDHGPGVPKSERRMIFQAFHRATRDISGPHSGLGLGLALARELARELGGRLSLNAEVADGAEFCLTVPATRT